MYTDGGFQVPGPEGLIIGALPPVIILYLFLILCIALGYFFLWQRKDFKLRQVRTSLAVLKKKEPYWDREKLEALVKERYMGIQEAWSAQDREKLKPLLKPELFQEWCQSFDRMEELGQKNIVEKTKVLEAQLIDIQDYLDDEEDCFTAIIKAQAADYTVDSRGKLVVPEWRERSEGEELGGSVEKFVELWTFEREGQDWALRTVEEGEIERMYVFRDVVLEDDYKRKKRG